MFKCRADRAYQWGGRKRIFDILVRENKDTNVQVTIRFSTNVVIAQEKLMVTQKGCR